MKRTNQKTETATTEAERFRDFVKQVISVPKEEIDKREAEYQANKIKKQSAKKKPSIGD